ncbi:hypothetical protein HYALB_00010259 [Hymenoscyphus albidus]|uniref:Uncharacterized protein n=1 Tax=Hymenoscyphus albidus TaxID=595503 RepID=A0A9N9LT58_9HELO|nr:hypothetical protein HYALB_00010259 [Hymenoscyphus albidus]
MPSLFHRSKPGDATSEHIEDKESLVDKKELLDFYKQDDDDFPQGEVFWVCNNCLIGSDPQALKDYSWGRLKFKLAIRDWPGPTMLLQPYDGAENQQRPWILSVQA